MNNKEALELWKNANIGSNVFCWGNGFIASGIRIFQKIESIETAKRLSVERDIDYNIKHPTHVETKIDQKYDVSAEMEGVKEMSFERLLEEDQGLVLAEPIINTEEEEEWQHRVVNYLKDYVNDESPYDYLGVLSFIYRSLGLFLPLKKIWKYDFKFARFCSEIASEVYLLKGGKHFISIEEDPSKISPLEMFHKVQESRLFRLTILKNPSKEIKIEKEKDGKIQVSRC